MIDRQTGYIPLDDLPLFEGNEGVNRDALINNHVIHKGTPGYFPFNPYEAYRIRILSFANGAIYAIRNSNESSKIINERINAIEELMAKKLDELDQFKEAKLDNPEFGTELYQFYNKDLPNASGLKPKQIALAESFYVWQVAKHPVRTTVYTAGNFETEKTTGEFEITQIETPRTAQLTKQQRGEFLKIKSRPENQPKWYTDLDPWAQNALYKLVENINSPTDNDKWRELEKFRPAFLRHIPGESNSTQHELIIRRIEIDKTSNKRTVTVVSHTTALRQSAPTSFNMKDDKERQKSAEASIQQMLDYELARESKDAPRKAEIAFKNIWGILPNEKIKLPILLNGLLTPSDQSTYFHGKTVLGGKAIDKLGKYGSGDENNTKLTKEKSAAIDSYQKHIAILDSKNVIELLDITVGINNQRSGDLIPDQKFIMFARNFHSVLNQHVQESKAESKEEIHANEERIKRLKQLDKIVNLISTLTSTKTVENRNRNLYLAAAYDVATRLMSGISTGNCKSSKDRKGAELIAADALLIFYAEQQREHGDDYANFPPFEAHAQSRERRRYVEIFCELYASAHQLFVAHDNSPGSAGIKDEGILDPDIVAKLQSMRKPGQVQISNESKSSPVAKLDKHDTRGLYAASRQIAEFNKPGTFWQKHGKKIKRGVMVAVGIIATVIFGACVGMGFLSPLGLLGIPASVALTRAGLHYPDREQTKLDERQTFTAQKIAAGIDITPPASPRDIPMRRPTKSSHSAMPFAPSLDNSLHASLLDADHLQPPAQQPSTHRSPFSLDEAASADSKHNAGRNRSPS